MNIIVDEKIHLELINENHSQAIFDLVDKNRIHLRQWLSFVDKMQSVDFARNFVKGTMQRNKEGIEYAFVIMEDDRVIGRIGVYKIDNQNKIGEIGYWIGENQQGKGSVTKSCKALISFCFNELKLNRLEIKCGTENIKSQAVPQRLHFRKEGVLRQAEFIHETYIDLYLYARCKSDR
jgi:ribosomal-protein-serine acetyltransferase